MCKLTLSLIATLCLSAATVNATGVQLIKVLAEERGKSMESRSLDVTRLSVTETKQLGWDPTDLDAVFHYAGSLSTDTLMIVTDDKIVGMFGDIERQYHTHSAVKAFLSALVGQHIGPGENQIRLDATLEELGIDDLPNPLTPLQRQATVLDLLKSISGINHAAAGEAGIMQAEKDRRLGNGENTPGTIWAYNNWDVNALTTIFETRTGMSIAEAFEVGISKPIGMLDHTPDAISYHREEPNLSQHRGPSLKMSARDLARFGDLYLNKGVAEGERLLPESWIDRIANDFMKTNSDDVLRHGHSYLWWIPGPDSGLPEGSIMAWGLGQQAVLVIPAWQTVIVHQSDTAEFLKHWFWLIEGENVEPEAAFERIVFGCLNPENQKSEFCVEHRFIRRPEIAELMSLIAKAHL